MARYPPRPVGARRPMQAPMRPVTPSRRYEKKRSGLQAVQYGSGQGAAAWNFGHLDKNMLK